MDGQATKETTRSGPVGQVRRGFGDGQRCGTATARRHSGNPVRAQWRVEGRQGAGSSSITSTAQGNCPSRCQKALGQGSLVSYLPKLYDPPPIARRRISPVTVCIAVRNFGSILLISDRMITAGDIQFEPPTEKILFLTSSIAVMAAGDSAFHAEIVGGVMRDVQERAINEPDNWWNVKDVVDLYVQHRIAAKLKRAEVAILRPLGLDRASFLQNQKIMDAQLVSSISSDLINFQIPDVEAIFAGVDNHFRAPGAHIYSVLNEYISCDDIIGFRAIGSGARHAESALMLAGHSWNTDFPATVLLTYSAKKRSEIAPGVGVDTDMFIIGPQLGSFTRIAPPTMQKLDEEYRKTTLKYAEIHAAANLEMTRYVEDLGKADATSQAATPAPEIEVASAAKPTAEPPEGGQNDAVPSTAEQK